MLLKLQGATMICTNVTCKDRKYISFLLLKVKKIFIF